MLYRFGRFEVDATEFLVRCDGEPVSLEPKALHLLLYMVARPGRLVRKQQLLDELWPGVAVTDNALTRSMTLLRRALGDDSRTPVYIETVPRIGYRFIADVTTPEEPTASAGLVAPLQDASGSTLPAMAAGGSAEDSAGATPASPAWASATLEDAAAPETPAAQAAQPGSLPRAGWAGTRVRVGFAAGALAVTVTTLLLVVSSVWHHAGGTVPFGALLTRQSQVASATQPPVAAIPAEAQHQYQRGLFFYDRRNSVASAAAFRKAIELAPAYAPAHAGLALALNSQALLSGGVPSTYIPEAIASAKRAIALDPTEAEAYVALGTIQTTFTWEWQDAEKNLREGIRLDSNSSGGHLWLAVLLQQTGRAEESAKEAETAVAAEPLSFFVVRMQASMLYFARRYDESLHMLERAREMQPQHPNVVDNWLGWIDEQRGLYDEAVTHNLHWLEQQGASPAELAQLRSAYARAGWTGYWKQRIDDMGPDERADCGQYFLGVALLRTADREGALTALKEATRLHCFWMGMVGVDPAFDPLRGDPRFQAMQRSILNVPDHAQPVEHNKQMALLR